MSQQELEKISRLGRQVDPLIIESLRNGSAREFASSLNYHFESGGKRMRAAMVIMACGSAGGKVEQAIKPAAVVEMIHNYSLVMDDLIDRGEVRRGQPTVRVRLGDSVALLVAMFYREVLDDLIQTGPASKTVRRISVRAMKEIIEGERLDLLLEQAGRDDPYLMKNRKTKPAFGDYLNMIGKKTAALFKAAGEIGGSVARADKSVVKALGTFGWKAGLAFQVMDDVLDICATKTGKEQAKDVVEHKLGNAVVLVAMRFLSLKKRRELARILATEKVSKTMRKRAITLVNETPAERDCREIAMKYLQDAKDQLSILPGSSYKTGLLKLADEVVARSY
ncbi:MAG TPA: polyprenyl synthetase family protein [Candidatus Bathyarchaeia archaeon]|nr:polyprenyl synthetase family protein [Candidatus Bathyarchaeia archaeon]